ncbi:MAG: hypothetical protein E7505_09635 [Ruminococcus sp.]|nr:hypothetical protein [Ruminococcus sp.]
MQNYTLNFRSPTAQIKAQNLLSAHGIKSLPGKMTSPTDGCIYTLRILSDKERAISILKEKMPDLRKNGGALI